MPKNNADKKKSDESVKKHCSSKTYNKVETKISSTNAATKITFTESSSKAVKNHSQDITEDSNANVVFEPPCFTNRSESITAVNPNTFNDANMIKNVNEKLDFIIDTLKSQAIFEEAVKKSFVEVFTDLKMIKGYVQFDINGSEGKKSLVLQDFPLTSEDDFNNFVEKVGTPEFRSDIVSTIFLRFMLKI